MHSLRLPHKPLLCTLIIFATLQLAFTRERGPRVEVTCPVPPVPVKVADQRLLVYELHITNFDAVPLTLKRLEIFPETDKSQPLKTYSDDTLSSIMLQVGSKDRSKESQIIEPGKRAVVFLWIELDSDKPAPATLMHRMIFASSAPEGSTGNTGTEAILQGFPVPIGRDEVPLLSSPFEGGIWLAGDLANDSGHRRTLVAIDGHVHAPERFAIDWVKVGPNGDSHHDGTAHNENWWGYGERIHAVAEGVVTQVVNEIPENTPRVLPQPVTLDNIAGNYVIIRVAPNRYITYAHLQTGSIKVRVDDHVHRGEVLGLLGNSGNSTAPHLHFQVTDGNSVLQSEGVPFIFDMFTYLGPGSEYEVNKHPSISLENSLPVNNAVVEFTSATK